MLNLIKLEIAKIKYAYLFSIVFGLLYSVVIILPYTTGNIFNHNIQLWDMSGQIFCYIYPLFAVMPICWLLYYERKNHFLAYTQTRVSKKKYLLSKYLTASVGGGFIIFIMSLVSLIICLYIIPDISSSLNPVENVIASTFQGEYYISHPFFYGLILSFWRFVIGCVIATFGFTLSLYIKNLFIIFTLPFVYTIGENFTLSVLGLARYRLFTSFWPGQLSAKAITYGGLLIGPLLLIVIIALTLLYFAIIKKDRIYDI